MDGQARTRDKVLVRAERLQVGPKHCRCGWGEVKTTENKIHWPRCRIMVSVDRRCIFKLLRSPGVDFKESIPPAYVAWWAGTTSIFL
jgi:hypothetical protein